MKLIQKVMMQHTQQVPPDQHPPESLASVTCLLGRLDWTGGKQWGAWRGRTWLSAQPHQTPQSLCSPLQNEKKHK